MPEPLLAILKLCALALLYLFFFRVLRAVWAEVRVAPPAAAVAAPTTVVRKEPRRRRRADRLVVVEPTDQRGRVYELGDEATLGRASGCQVTLDDHYASQLHARVFRKDDRLYVEDLGSTNGTYLNTRRVTGATALKRGDKLKIGSTVLEVGG